MTYSQVEHKTVLFLDFDGTLTGLDGRSTVFGQWYKSLLNNPSELIYKDPNVKLQTDIQDRFNKKFGEPFCDASYRNEDANTLISKQALDFLLQALDLEGVIINIITKNRKDYIQALLQYQGISSEQNKKIHIYDTCNKQYDVEQALNNLVDVKIKAIICDDSKEDGENMKAGLEIKSQDHELFLYHAPSGQFNWVEIQEKLLALEPKQLQIFKLIKKLISELNVKPNDLENNLNIAKDKFISNKNSDEFLLEIKAILDPKNFPESLGQQCLDAIKRFLNAVIHLLRCSYQPHFFQTQDLHIQAKTKVFNDSMQKLIS